MKPKYHNPKNPTNLELCNHLLLVFIEPCVACSRIIKFFCFLFFLQQVWRTKYKTNCQLCTCSESVFTKRHTTEKTILQRKLGIWKLFVAQKI